MEVAEVEEMATETKFLAPGTPPYATDVHPSFVGKLLDTQVAPSIELAAATLAVGALLATAIKKPFP